MSFVQTFRAPVPYLHPRDESKKAKRRSHVANKIRQVAVPDFFIIGAPKCGTTSVYDFLRKHPKIFMPDFKEPQYFCSDLTDLRQIKTESKYAKLFNHKKPGQVVGEASAWYLYSKDAVNRILAENPEAKFIVMLRDPIKAIASFHNNSVISLAEKYEEFEQAWDAQKPNPANPATDYKGVYKFSDQLERLYAAVPKERIKVVLLEELIESPEAEYNAITAFLGLQPSTNAQYPHENVARHWNSKFVRNFLLNPSPAVRMLMGIFKKVCNTFSIRPIHILHWLFAVEGMNKPLSANIQKMLRQEFEVDITRLKKEFGLPVDRLWRTQD